MALPSQTVTTLNGVLKSIYTDEEMQALVYQDLPLFAALPKKEDFTGKDFTLALAFASGQARSADYASANTALATVGAAQYGSFKCTRVRDYQLINISTEAIEAGEGKEDALVNVLEEEMELAILNLKKSLGISLYGNGGGAIGQISAGSNTGTPTITLANTSQIANFEKGMILNVSATDGTSGAIRVGTVTVLSLNRDLGTITATGNWTAGIAAAAASDFIFQLGDFGVRAQGLAAWLPTTVPTAGDNFNGQDRSLDSDRLAGIRVVGSGRPKEETLQRACAKAKAQGAMGLDVGFVHPDDITDLEIGLGSRVFYDRVKAFDNPDIGFSSVTVKSAVGTINLVADPFCPKGTAYLLSTKNWCFRSMGKAPRILTTGDGLEWLRDASTDSVTARLGWRGNLMCRAPGYNVVISW